MRCIAALSQTLAVAVVLLATATTTPATAFELPDIHNLPGETFPVSGEGVSTKAAESVVIETESGSRATAEQLQLTMKLEALSALGPIALDFINVIEPKTKSFCNTEGDATGVVLVTGEYHVVDTKLSPLTAALLILLPLGGTTTFTCGKLKLKVTGTLLLNLNVKSAEEVTSFGTWPKCIAKGRQDTTTYFNDAGTELTKQLLSANFGLGAEFACLETKAEVRIVMSKMIEFLF